MKVLVRQHWSLLLAFCIGCIPLASAAAQPAAKPVLLAELPDFCPTPDGMAIDAEGNLVIACPNYGDPTQAACLIRIDADGEVAKWVDVPVLKETGRACPMGIAFGRNGDLYVCDNQNWPTGNGDDGNLNQGRLLKLRIRDGKIAKQKVIASGISHPNGVRYRDGKLFVTVSMLPKVKREDGLLTSAVYAFPAKGKTVQVTNTLDDEHIIATFATLNRHCQYGADGLAFDRAGNLYVGNFGDGAIHKVTFDEQGEVTSNTVFAKTDHDYELDPEDGGFLAKAVKARMRTTDGMCIDAQDNIYVADFSNNAVAKVTSDGKITVVAQNGDTDGREGLLDQPGEPILWNNRLVVTCFDMVTGPDKVNTGHDKPYTIAVIDVD